MFDADEVVLSVVGRIWPPVDVSPDQDWVDLLATYHGVDVQPLDFAGDPDGSRQSMNDWVADNTQGLIPELLPPGFVRPKTVLVLSDAWYLKARWQSPFVKYGPEQGSFTRPDGSTVPVEFLRHLELADRRGTGDRFAGAEIPYDGGEFSMLVLVPDAGRFDEVRDRLNQAFLDEVDARFTTGPYELLLPPWEDTAQIDLLPWLSQLPAAPGSYPVIAPDAFLDAVHGADITVDDWGTVAAAATALGFGESAAPEPELTVGADRPFLYLIRHRPTGLVLFAGQVGRQSGSGQA